MYAAEQELITSMNIHLTARDAVYGGIKLHSVEAGRGGGVLLLHGANMGWGQWYKTLPELAKQFRVAALDLPGAGASETVNPATLDFENKVVEVVAQFIKTAFGSRTAVVGHSLGAWVAMKVALKYPNLVSKLVLVSPLGFSTATPPFQKAVGLWPLAWLLSKTVVRPTKQNLKKFLTQVMTNPQALDDIFVNYYYTAVAQHPYRHPFRLINRLAGFFKVRPPFVLLPQLKELTQPVLVVLGKSDPIVKPTAALLEAVRGLLRAKVRTTVYGHVPFIENPNEFNEQVIHFLHTA